MTGARVEKSSKPRKPGIITALLLATVKIIFFIVMAWLFLVFWFLFKTPNVKNIDFLTLLLKTSEIVLTRLIQYELSLPLFVVVIGVLAIDGLVMRDIRRFQGARESTFIFHRAKRGLSVCIFIPFLIYLACPISLSSLGSALFLLLHAMLVGLLLRIAITHFKKYV